MLRDQQAVWSTTIAVRSRLADSLGGNTPARLLPCCLRIVPPLKNTPAIWDSAMAVVPLGVLFRFVSVFFLPLDSLKAVSRDESLRDQHVAVEVALAAQAKLFRSGYKCENLCHNHHAFSTSNPLAHLVRIALS